MHYRGTDLEGGLSKKIVVLYSTIMAYLFMTSDGMIEPPETCY